jgi:hypothetical protein
MTLTYLLHSGCKGAATLAPLACGIHGALFFDRPLTAFDLR